MADRLGMHPDTLKVWVRQAEVDAGQRDGVLSEFIAEHKDRFGVASICTKLTELGDKIAARTFYAWVGRVPSKRSLLGML